MTSRERPWTRRYGVAAAGVALATLARVALTPWMGEHQPFPTYYVALTLAAGYGGRGPVLFAIVAGYIAANWFVVPPRFVFSVADAVGVAAFLFVGLAIAAFSDVMRAAQRLESESAERARSKQAQLELEVARRERVERDRKGLIAALEAERRQLEAVLQQMPAGVIIAEAPSGRFVLANDQVQRIWQQPYVAASDYQGHEAYPAFHPDGKPYRSHEGPLARSLAMGEVVKDEEVAYRRGDGSMGVLCISSAPIRDREGMIIAAVVVFYDVTARKTAEEELENRVIERTRELAEANAALGLEVQERRLAEVARDDLLRRLVRVQEEERGRVAHELHDQMGQQLVALKLGLEALKGSGEASGDRCLEARLDRLLDLTRRLGRDMHRVAWELGAAIEGEDLPRALASYAVEWSAQAGVPVQFHSSGRWDDRPPPQAESTVYRVVQEALTNVVKHAGADRVSLIVDRRLDHVLAIVEDDGVGFDLEGLAAGDGRSHRLGLTGMKRRAEAVGGTVEVESSPRRGTTVFVRVPTGAAAGGDHE